MPLNYNYNREKQNETQEASLINIQTTQSARQLIYEKRITTVCDDRKNDMQYRDDRNHAVVTQKTSHHANSGSVL